MIGLSPYPGGRSITRSRVDIPLLSGRPARARQVRKSLTPDILSPHLRQQCTTYPITAPSVETSHSPHSTPPFSVTHTTMTQVIGEVPNQLHTSVKRSRLYCIGSATWGSVPRDARKWNRKKIKIKITAPFNLSLSLNSLMVTRLCSADNELSSLLC